MPKQTVSGAPARAFWLRGIDFVANPVGATLGPRGRNILLDRPGQPVATRDGVTVAKEVSWLPDPFENMGAAYAREVADAAVVEAGDGTTTATVLLQAITHAGARLIDKGIEPLLLADGIELAVNRAAAFLEHMAVEATPELIRQAAIISTHGDQELGKLIADATAEVGAHGVIELLESRNHETTFEKVDGFYFERGWLPHQIFVNSSDGKRVILDNPYILISERMIVGGTAKLRGDHIYNIVGQCVEARRPLLIIAENLIGDAFNLVVANAASGPLPGAGFVMPPGFGDSRTAALRDLAAAVGCRRIHTQASTRAEDVLSDFKLADLGQCKQAIISPDRTVLIGGDADPEAVKDRARQLIAQSAEASNPYDQAQLEHRVARLMGGVGFLRVGDRSEPAMLEKKARAEDAVHACRAARASGLVPGGGVALLRASAYLATLADRKFLDRHQRAGFDLIVECLRAPICQIARNAGNSPRDVEKIVKNVLAEHGSIGYDAAHGSICDLFAAGVVDPAKVVLVALRKAASIGALLLTTEALVADIPAPVPAQAQPPAFRVR